ncbi:ABC transporter permease [Xylella taiwanensis]|uniref:ABC transporter permease n=1 Tax=Xylella taiwanensis TaxID=1444770 RepID=A0ABS8TVW9_9GAMM|nr:ABC transporter permease [Xylella taiwanensis]MCD8455723.1 ABC transporter permease [Xylella taiwanensis]MCD8458129.1 ABC transporter permease [Xylella taiwanensis]MCD8460265.1 ABC transporter permease [Xylella taiwanensis]MCD8463678.1 ABC transporter permease [Xylella taiwanensis]MCD8464767.1 ABC transporter permease [Xylella taiwanensis]
MSPGARHAFETTPSGVLVGAQLMQRGGWKVGQRLPLQAARFPDKTGSMNWACDIVGVLHAQDTRSGGFCDRLLLPWKTFDDTTPYNRGQVGWYVVEVKDVNEADRVAQRIDALSSNSDDETRPQSEHAAIAHWITPFVDVGLMVGSVMGAVFFTLMLLSGNTMMQAGRERTGELEVLKTLGFSNSTVLLLVLAESVFLLLLGGVIDLLVASVLIPAIAAGSGGMLNLPAWGAGNGLLGCGRLLSSGALVGVVPAWSAMRLNSVAVLRRCMTSHHVDGSLTWTAGTG